MVPSLSAGVRLGSDRGRPDLRFRDELGRRLSGHELHISEHGGAEVLSAIRGLRLGGSISDAIAVQALADYAMMPLPRHPVVPFIPRAWELRHAMTAYDALYVLNTRSRQGATGLATGAACSG